MQRYMIEAEQWSGNEVRLIGNDAHHASRVMRMKENSKFIAADGKGRAALVSVKEVSAELVTGEILEWLADDNEPRWSITIAQSLPKGDKMELVIQKGTEIGAAAFVPFESERMIVQYDSKKEAKRLERWNKIAKEASEQAHRSIVPMVAAVRSWKELLNEIEQFDLALFCYEEEGRQAVSRGIGTAVKRWKQQLEAGSGEVHNNANLLVIVGPEGGFTEREAREAEAAGAVIAGLGRRILRTETAGIVALTCLLYEAGEMEGA